MENAYMQNPYFLELADRLKACHDQKKALEVELKQVNAEISRLDEELSSLMLNVEMQNFTHAGTLFYVNSRFRANPKAGLRDELFSALRKEGHGGMITETINSNTLSSFVKEQIADNGDVLPEWLSGLVSISKTPTIGVRKAAR